MLTALALIVACLPAAGLAAAVFPGRAAPACATAVLCGAGALTALAFLAAGAVPDAMTLPLGAPGGPMRLALDPLSGFFLLVVLAAATADATCALDERGRDRAAPFLPVAVAAMALALLAADAFTMLAGFALTPLAFCAAVLASGKEPASRDAALPLLGVAALAVACLLPAFALLSPDGGLDFAAIRAAPHEGWRAAAALALALAGAGSQAGLAPLHVWGPAAQAAAPSHVGALMSGAMTKVAAYVLVRVLFDLCGPAQPVWFGVPLLLAGAASAVLGAVRSAGEADMRAALAFSAVGHGGFIAAGLGLALIARGADLLPLAALALGGALLHAASHAGFQTLLLLCAGAVQRGAGTLVLSRLGGLIRAMPWTAGCALLGCASLAGLPPSAGFAGEWMLLQSAIAAPRAGGLPVQLTTAVAAAALVFAVGLGAAAAVRLFGVAFLGRPRTPRGSAADEPGRPARAAMLGLAVLCAAAGLAPGSVLALADPALRALLGAGLDGRSMLAIAPQAGAPGYAPLGVAALLAAGGAGAWLAARRFAERGVRRAPAWDGGFAAPPPWLPFGDPATQYGAGSFAQPLLRALSPLGGATEAVEAAGPGDPRPARLVVMRHAPAEPFARAARLARRVSGLAALVRRGAR